MQNPYGDDIRWIPDDQYAKLVGRLRLQLNGLFEGFCAKGSGTFTTSIVGMECSPFLEEIIKLSEDFGLLVRGVDKPISLEEIRRKQGRIV